MHPAKLAAAAAPLALALAACSPSPAAPAHTQPPAAPSPLSAGQRRFVHDVRAALAAQGSANPITDATLGEVAGAICRTRKAGETQADVTRVTARSGRAPRLAMTARQLIRTAEEDACPAEIPLSG